MFFFDDNGIMTVQLGMGDVMVSDVRGKGHDECTGIVFGEKGKGDIGEAIPDLVGKYDYEAATKIKILFTDTKSIDVVIEKLENAKKNLKPNN